MATSQAPASLVHPPALRTMIRGLLPSIVVNAVLPYLLFNYLKSHTSASDLVALLVSGVPALLGEVVTIGRQRKLDVLGVFVLAAIAVSTIVSAIGGDPKILLVRESFISSVFGVACLASLLVPRLAPRPLLFYIIRYFASGNDPAKEAAFNARWQDPAFRQYMRIVTLVWGIVYVVEFPVRFSLVQTLTIKQFLAISPILYYGLFIGLIAFTLAYRRRLATQR